MPETFLDQLLYVVIIVLKIVAVLVPLILAVAYYTYAERKVIGFMQIRVGPNRVGPRAWLQPIEDAIKLLMEAIEAAGYAPGDDIAIALDTASSEFFADGTYNLVGEGREVMAELVDEQVARPAAVGCRSAEESVNSSTTVIGRIICYGTVHN